ncbi:MFS transporter [Sphingomonas sp.]|uniref:MFS transporter n=1 Tax=Sphingomonas sp. TaxID=28214 RepID=UPI001D4875FE|nr:MFS transporter [Sphingomonas sp.]MBX9796986.1 MFS transporter [Sphingomonas sp.]
MTRATRSDYPWILIGLLWIVAFFNAADRSIIIAVMPSIKAEFGLSNTELALLNSVFFWIYAVAAFLSGRMGDSMKRSRIIIYGLIFWSMATGLTALSTGFAMLLGFRALVALGEATYYPTATALISDWHEARFRSRALSLHQTGVFAGAELGALFAGLLADRYSWHTPFAVFAAVGILHAIILLRFLKDAPATVERAAGSGDPLKLVLRNPSALMLCVVFFLANGASTGVTVWAPTYVHDALKLDLAGSALVGSATINIAGFLTVPLGGLLADWMARRSPVGRFHTLAIGLTLAATLLLPLTSMTSAAGVGVVLVATSFGKGLFDGCIYAAMHDVVPARGRATAVGAMTMIGFFGAGVTPIFVAWAADHFGMAAGMTSLAALYVLAVVIILAMLGSIRRAVDANAGAHA